MQEIHRDTPRSKSDDANAIEDIIDFALDAHLRDECRESNTPDGIFHTQLWSFARAIRSCFPEEAEADTVFWNRVSPEIERRGGWGILETYLDVDEIYTEFICNWHAVRYRIGETPLGNAIQKAERFPLRPWRAKGHRVRLSRYSRFVSIAGWLQVSMGDCPILLPVGKLAELIGVSPMQVTRYRQMAQLDGYLRIVCGHNYTRRKATEFRFDVTRFPVLQSHAQVGTEHSFAVASS